MNWKFLIALSALAGSLGLNALAADKKIVLIAGNPSHGPGLHEYRAGCLLLQKCLKDFPGLTTEVYDHDWPTRLENGQPVDDNAALEDADAIVIFSDGGPKHPLLAGNRLAVTDRLMKKGVGLGLIHYAVEPTQEKGESEIVEWIGGAFSVNWSVNPFWDATFKTMPRHPVARGVAPFTLRDEWYFHMRFRDGMHGITPILTAVPTAETMIRPDGHHSNNPAARAVVAAGDPQTVMWVAWRENEGRGFGFNGGHFHTNWQNDNVRKAVLNAMLWIAKLKVPPTGVVSSVSDAEIAANLDVKPVRPTPRKQP